MNATCHQAPDPWFVPADQAQAVCLVAHFLAHHGRTSESAHLLCRIPERGAA